MPANLKSSYSGWTGTRQTMLSWAREIDSFEAVPEAYQTPYRTLVGAAGALPYTVLAPAQPGSRTSKSTERLLCETGGTFYVLEQAEEQVLTTGYPYQDICSLELGNILLYSYFSISGRTTAGAESTLTVEFNEATLRHFQPFFSKMRPAPAGPDPFALKVEQAKFDCLSAQNFKFMNFARGSLVPGEKVLQFLYQPQKRQSVLTVFGRSLYRTLFLAHLTILTEEEIILIGDSERITEKKRSRYGGVWRFLPLRSLVSATLEARPDDLFSFTLNVSCGDPVVRLFDASHLPELEALKKGINSSSLQKRI